MTRTPISLSGACMASMAAGPLFLLGLGIGIWSGNPAMELPIGSPASVVLPGVGILFVTTLFGAVIAIAPNVIGTAIMTRLGDLNQAFRLPLMWGMAGAFCGAAPAGGGGASPEMVIALGFTGLSCALLCRSRLTISDEQR